LVFCADQGATKAALEGPQGSGIQLDASAIGGLEYDHFAAPGRLPPIRALEAGSK
jgi:hypothetical protein